MSQSESPNEPAGPAGHHLGFLLLPSFNAGATTAAIDPFRVANYLSARRLYRWTLVSPDGAPVLASNGMTIGADCALAARPAVDMLFVCSSWAPERHKDKALFAWLRKLARAGITLGAIDTGAIVLAQAGLLKGYQATVHFEHLDALQELFPDVDAREQIFVIDRDRVTCCGNNASSDLALEIIRLHHGLDLANAAARYLFHERLRAPGESQLHPAHEPVGSAVPRKLLKAIHLMERNIDEPLELAALAREAGLSLRHMERLFRDQTGASPGRYYLNLRLDRARGLITQTQMQVLEVAVACGFASPEHFTRVYKRRFAISPRDDRVAGRIPFQFRTLPLHASVPDVSS
ncbi:MAG: GlxA family transcriptional regulator [Pseudomonadota bacterium]